MIRMWMALAVLWSCFVLGILSTRFNLFRLRTLLAGCALLGLTVVTRALLRGWRPHRFDAAATSLVALQGLLIFLGSLAYGLSGVPFGMASLGLLTGIGWLAWVETRARPRTGETTAVSERAAYLAFAGCMVVSAALMVGFWRSGQAPLVPSVEGLLYRMQAHTLAGAGAAYHVDPEVVGAFRLPWIAYAGDTLVPRSAAGWPLLLAAAQRLGADAWLGLILTLLNVTLTAVIGQRLLGRRGAILAAAFVAFNPIVTRFGPTYLPQAATVSLLLAGTLLLLSALERPPDEGRRLAAELAGGLAFGLAILMRPLSAMIISISVVLWLCSRRPGAATHALSRTVPRLVLGGVPLIALFAIVDGFGLGSPFRWSHTLVLTGSVGRVREMSISASEALKATWFSFGATGAFALPGYLLLSDLRPKIRPVLPFLLVPALGILVVAGRVSLYHDLVPFAAIGFAWAILELRRRDASLARAACILTLAGALSVSGLLLYSIGRLDVLPAVLHEMVSAGQARWGRLLIVVPVGTPEEVMARLWTYNVDGPVGDVVIAMETNPTTNRAVLEGWGRDRRPVLLRKSAAGAWQLVPLSSVVNAMAHPLSATGVGIRAESRIP